MSLAPYIRILGRGPSRTRALTRDEARDAMRVMISGDAAPEAIGALLMLMRFRGENADEIAGFTDALRTDLSDWKQVTVALDWPSYAAGRSRGAPWYLLAARLVAQAGVPVLMHGWNSHQLAGADLRSTLTGMGVAQAMNPAEATDHLTRSGLVYVPAEALHPRALSLLKLRDVLGLRSCMNTVQRMLNPAGAAAMVQGVFHPSYRDLQSDAAALLGETSLGVIKGGGGEFERHPAKEVLLYGVRGSTRFELPAPALIDDTRRLHDVDMPDPAPTDIWTGAVEDPFVTACVTGTAALALFTCGKADTLDAAQTLSNTLWQARDRGLAA